MPFTPANEESLKEISEALLWKLSGGALRVTLHLDRDEALTLLAALEHKGVVVEDRGVPA